MSSDWEVYSGESDAASKLQDAANNSDWEVFSDKIPDTISERLSQAPGKIAQDVYGGIQNFAGKVPGYYEAAKTEIPSAINIMEKNPELAQKNRMAGLAELGKNIFNSPHDFIDYLSNRLNLFPKNINKMVQMGRMPEKETQEAINQRYGTPREAGEEFIRGAPNVLFNVGSTLGGLGSLNSLRPSNLIKQKASTISNEYKAAKALEKNTFSKVFDKYGSNHMTTDAKQLFSDLGIQRKKLLPDAKNLYDEILKNPSLKNIHNFQSQISNDANRVYQNYPNKYQTLRQYKNKLIDITTDFLEKTDKNALNNYNKGRQITRDLVSPYTSNKALEQVSKGVNKNISVKGLTNAIKKGQKSIVYEREGKPVTAIHPEHVLNNHLKKIERLMNLNKFSKYGLGAALVGLGGNEVYRNFLNKNSSNNEGNY